MYEDEIHAAFGIARQAGELALRYFESETGTEEKEDRSPVTVADRECEKLIGGLIEARFPEDGILGEEGASKRGTSGRRWLVDPIDGTRDFVRRNPFWSIQIALQSGDRVVLGLIHFPCLGETVKAVAGSGCYWNDERVRGPGTDRLDKAILSVSGFANAWDRWPPDGLRALTEKCWTVRAYGGCYDVAMFARGKVDIWLSGGGSEWDYGPVRIISEECGAPFLTRDGGDRIDADHCLVCPRGLEAELRRVLRIGNARRD